MKLRNARRAAAALTLAAAGLATAGCLGGATRTVTVVRTRTVPTTRTVITTSSAQSSACTGDELTGTFAEIPGSEGAGQIAYKLTLKNTSGSGCWLAASPPQVRLLEAAGSPLPTNVIEAQDVTQSTPPATLQPGKAATANVRFSPDVAGTGDAQHGPCQPEAHTLEVTATGGGVVQVPLEPPTSVCERGTLSFGLLQS